MHDVGAAFFIVLSAGTMVVLLGTRALLAMTHRTAGRRLRALMGVDDDEPPASAGDLAFYVGFIALTQFLVLVVLIDNVHRPDGGLAFALAALEIAFIFGWLALVAWVTSNRNR
jgi:hypothetical protein